MHPFDFPVPLVALGGDDGAQFCVFTEAWMVVFLDYEVRRVAQAKQKSSSAQLSSWDGQAQERDWKKQLRKLRFG